MGLALKKDQVYFTYKDYCSWPENERWELIHGVAYDMSPAPGRFHQDIVLELGTILKNWLKGKPCKVYIAPFDVRLPNGDEPDNMIENVVQPDIVVICDSNKLDDKGAKGAPDWIIEILSSSTAKKDFDQKYHLYEKHGVKEYWIIDPERKCVYLYRLDDSGQYREFALLEESNNTAECLVLSGLAIRLSDIFNSK